MTDAAERLRDMLTNMDPADAPAPGLLVRLLDEALADAYVAGVRRGELQGAAEERERSHRVAVSMREVIAIERNGKHDGIPFGWLNTIDQWAAILDAPAEES